MRIKCSLRIPHPKQSTEPPKEASLHSSSLSSQLLAPGAVSKGVKHHYHHIVQPYGEIAVEELCFPRRVLNTYHSKIMCV